ncbi:MAG: hypothetical protein Q4D26_04685 [Clostridia bacterium]|nr:hypothetical protein [Clostridia bacterium]
MSLINAFKESLIITAVTNVFKSFITGYENSRVKSAVNAVTVCFKDSKTYSVLSRYANKKPYYRQSLIYRLIMAIAGLFDRLFGSVNSIGSKWLEGSAFSAKVYKAIKSPAELKLYGFGILFMSIPVGSIISLILTGGVSPVNMAICWGVFVVGFVFVAAASCGSYVKSSALFKVISGFIDLIR